MALPQSVALSCFVFILVVVLQLSAAPLEFTTIVSPQSDLSEVTLKSANASTTPSSNNDVTSTSSFTTLSSLITSLVTSTESTSSSSVSEVSNTDIISSPVPTTQSPFSSDEAIRHLPGYWIKRPSMSSSSDSPTNPGDEGEEHPGEAQESFVDYRTERYQIEDLFPAHTLIQEEQNVTAKSQEDTTPLQEGPV